MSRYAHLEYDKGYIVFTGPGPGLQVWRRSSDEEQDPSSSTTPEDWQSELAGTVYDPESLKGVIRPIAFIRPPGQAHASRFVYPHLLLGSSDGKKAWLYHVPLATLLHTFDLAQGETTPPRWVRYVELSGRNGFACTAHSIKILDLSSGRVVDTVYCDDIPHPMSALVRTDGSHVQSVPSIIPITSCGRELAQETRFVAMHVSPCGEHLVAFCQLGRLYYWPNFAGHQKGGERHGYSLELKVGPFANPELRYLAYDGRRIAIATVSRKAKLPCR